MSSTFVICTEDNLRFIDDYGITGGDRDNLRAITAQSIHSQACHCSVVPLNEIQVKHIMQIGIRLGRASADHRAERWKEMAIRLSAAFRTRNWPFRRTTVLGEFDALVASENQR